jgi:hypothetical protein
MPSGSWIDAAKDIHASILATNVFTAFTLAIASIVRLRQHAFLFELMFIKKLNLLQLILVVVSWIFAGLLLSDEGADS